MPGSIQEKQENTQKRKIFQMEERSWGPAQRSPLCCNLPGGGECEEGMGMDRGVQNLSPMAQARPGVL